MPPKRRNVNQKPKRATRSPTPERTPKGGKAKAKAEKKQYPCNVIMQDEELIGQKIKEAQDQVQAKLSQKVIEKAIEQVRAANLKTYNEMDKAMAEKKGVKFIPQEPEKSETSVTDSSDDGKDSSESLKSEPTTTVQNILDRHTFMVKFVCEQTSEYELETLPVYQKEAIKIKAADKKKSKVSQIETTQFKRMKWHANHTGMDWEDQSFLFFERANKGKTPTLAAVTECCHSLCFFKRHQRFEGQNGVEDHWCPLASKWVLGQDVKFLTLHQIQHFGGGIGFQGQGENRYFKNLKGMVMAGHTPITARGRFWGGRTPMGPRAAVIKQDDMPLKVEGETQIFSAAKRQKTDDQPSTILFPSKVEASVDAVRQIQDIDKAMNLDENVNASHTSIYDDEAQAKKDEEPISQTPMEDVLEEAPDKTEEPVKEEPKKEEPKKEVDQTMIIDDAADFLKKLREKNERELAEAKAKKEKAAEEAQKSQPLQEKPFDVSGIMQPSQLKIDLPASDNCSMSIAPALTPPATTPKGNATPNSLVPKSPRSPRLHYETLVGLREHIDTLKDKIKVHETTEKALRVEIFEGVREKAKLVDVVNEKSQALKDHQEKIAAKDKELADKEKKLNAYKTALEVVAAQYKHKLLLADQGKDMGMQDLKDVAEPAFQLVGKQEMLVIEDKDVLEATGGEALKLDKAFFSPDKANQFHLQNQSFHQ